MFVGVCRLNLHLQGNDSLKGKRKILRSIIDRVRAKFNTSIAEVGLNDVHRSAVIAFSVIGNEASHIDSMLATILSFIDRMHLAPLSQIETEVIPLDGELENRTCGSCVSGIDMVADSTATDTVEEEELW